MKKNALIVGGSRGIGLATGRILKDNGYNVILTYCKSAEKVKDLEKEGFIVFKTDISIREDIDNLYMFVKENFDSLSVVVNNAGIALPQKLILDISYEEMKRLCDVNLLGIMYSTKLASDMMLSCGGNIINISSIWGKVGGVCESVYSATKAGLNMFTDVISRELESSDVSVSVLSPGIIETDMNSHLSEEDKNDFVNQNGIGEMGKPEEVGKKVLEIIQMEKKASNGGNFFVRCGNMV